MKKFFQIVVDSYQCSCSFTGRKDQDITRIYKFYAKDITEAKKRARSKFKEHNKFWKPTDGSHFSLREISKVLYSGNKN